MDKAGRRSPPPPRTVEPDPDREVLTAGEVQHRLRNLIAMIRSIFSRTVENTTSLDEMADHFQGRLDVLARYQAGFPASNGGSFDLETMIWDELIVYAVKDEPRVEIAGPPVSLNEVMARSLGMALHELITNSIKFGVLSGTGDGGKLSVQWQVECDDLILRWNETAVPIVSAQPIRGGFGRQYIEQALPFELNARTHFAVVPGGVECVIVIPLAGRVRPIDGGAPHD